MQDALILSIDNSIELCVIDSGASFHATSNREELQNYVTGNFGKVYLGYDEPYNIVRKVDVEIKTQGFKWCLKDVRHISKLKRNLISARHLRSADYVSTFTPDT